MIVCWTIPSTVGWILDRVKKTSEFDKLYDDERDLLESYSENPSNCICLRDMIRTLESYPSWHSRDTRDKEHRKLMETASILEEKGYLKYGMNDYVSLTDKGKRYIYKHFVE
jgi:hypothetical protein